MKLNGGDKNFIKKKKKLWNNLGYPYPGTGKGFFKRNHSLNCGCWLCTIDTYLNRKENRKERHKNKMYLRKFKKFF